jgi:hypothetical protein
MTNMLLKTLKNNDIILSVKELVKNDIVTLVHYYQHKIKKFQKK